VKHLAGLVALALLAVAGGAAAKGKSAVTIKNKSHWEIHQRYLSSSDQDEWGPDQLGQQTIAARSGTYTLTDIPCDKYDVRLVDEDGDECVVARVPLCADHDTWVIKDDDLLSCQSESGEDDDD
jgi:hypothetical protein